jgi:hypothetical protein
MISVSNFLGDGVYPTIARRAILKVWRTGRALSPKT